MNIPMKRPFTLAKLIKALDKANIPHNNTPLQISTSWTRDIFKDPLMVEVLFCNQSVGYSSLPLAGGKFEYLLINVYTPKQD